MDPGSRELEGTCARKPYVDIFYHHLLHTIIFISPRRHFSQWDVHGILSELVTSIGGDCNVLHDFLQHDRRGLGHVNVRPQGGHLCRDV